MGVLVLALTGVPASAQSSTFTEVWRSAGSPHFDTYAGAGSSATSGVSVDGATDGEALRLRLAARPDENPGGGAAAESEDRFLYGTFESRLRTANCAAQPMAGVVTGQLFTYFNNGTDGNDNGLPDNSEIDFETLCAQPEVVYLTIWTDYRAADSAQRRVMRAVNLRTGSVLATCFFEAFGWDNCQPLSGGESSPADIPAVPGFDSATTFYVYGFTWSATRVTYWIKVNGSRITLWDYQGPRHRIPHVAAYCLQNVWHTASWSPINEPDAVERPQTYMSAWIDWTRVTTS